MPLAKRHSVQDRAIEDAGEVLITGPRDTNSKYHWVTLASRASFCNDIWGSIIITTFVASVLPRSASGSDAREQRQ